MSRKFTKAAAVGIAAAALAAFGPAGNAAAANTVPCGNSEFVDVYYHHSSMGMETSRSHECWANGGYFMPTPRADLFKKLWVHRISSGNNVVWWEADGKWNRLPKWHVLHFPNHPGGVHVTNMYIGD